MDNRNFKKPYKHRRFVSRKDYKHVLGAAVLPDELSFVTQILNQGADNSCTAYAACAIRESMTGRAYNPEGQWKLEQQYVGHPAPEGIEIKDQLNTGIKLGFVPQDGGPNDKAFAYFFLTDLSFDGIKNTLAQVLRPLSCGLNWYTSFDAPDGIVPHKAEALLGGHDVKIAGFKTINGIEYLIIQNSWGTSHGNKGLFYFDKWTTEKYLGTYDIGYWSDDPNLPIERYGVLLMLLKNVAAVFQRLFKKSYGTYPPEQPVHVSRIPEWANAIAAVEGANPKWNNPGNLKYSTLTASWGARQGAQASDGGHLCQFSTYAIGLSALCNFLKLGCENQLLAFHQARTLEAFTKIYAGNPPQGYITKIATKLKVALDTDISTFL